MFNFFLVSVIALFSIINPLITLPPFITLVAGAPREIIDTAALRSCAIALGIFSVFALFSDALLSGLGISHGALILGGGILLFSSGFTMVTASSDGSACGKAETKTDSKAQHQKVLESAVFPIAFPLICGPGAISVTIARLAEYPEFHYKVLMILAAVVVIGTLYIGMRFSSVVIRVFGSTGLNIAQRMMGLLITAMSVQMVASGIQRLISQ